MTDRPDQRRADVAERAGDVRLVAITMAERIAICVASNTQCVDRWGEGHHHRCADVVRRWDAGGLTAGLSAADQARAVADVGAVARLVETADRAEWTSYPSPNDEAAGALLDLAEALIPFRALRDREEPTT